MKIADGWLDVAQEIDYSSKSMNRQGYKVTHLCLHGTAGGSSAQGIANYFATPDVQASAHIIIDQQGKIAQGVSMNDAAWGNGIITPGHASFIREDINPNWYTVSIEFVKASTDNSDALTAMQQQVGFEVIKCICDTYGIPKRQGNASGGIIRHADIDPINRARCPGTFPWQELWSYLAGNEEDETVIIDLKNPVVASHFSGDDNNWKCKDKDNNFIVGHGILNFYRKFGGDALCGLTYLGLPASNEQPVAGKLGVVYQRFERGVLVYDPSKKNDNPPGSGGVYLAHIDSGIGQDPKIDIMQSKIVALQAEIVALKSQLDGNTLAQELAELQAKIAQAVKDLEALIQ